ncbi:MAG: L,D-transpeptidase family protein [Myxococcota bacterium]|nr:L,D-transpeptidase family protein [Myxococcota bacterium]
MIFFASAALAAPIPADTEQLILGLAAHVDSSAATLQRFVRSDTGWQPVGSQVSARIGRAGMAWGLGLHPTQPGLQKVEGDWRAPAGVFTIGEALGDVLLSEPMAWPMLTVTERTLWVEDASSPYYNQHRVVPPGRPLTDWESSQRMRRGDPAHRLKVAIAHNTSPPVSGSGSAIFFHIWRGDGAKPTAGCTAMSAADLEALMRWLEPDAVPVFVLLSAADHAQLSAEWGLPALPQHAP